MIRAIRGLVGVAVVGLVLSLGSTAVALGLGPEDRTPGVPLVLSPIAGSLTATDTGHYYRIALAPQETITASLNTGSRNSVSIAVTGADGSVPLVYSDSEQYPKTVTYTSPTARVCMVRLWNYGGVGPFTVTWSRSATPTPSVELYTPQVSRWGEIVTVFATPFGESVAPGCEVILERRASASAPWSAVGTFATDCNGQAQCEAVTTDANEYRAAAWIDGALRYSAPAAITVLPSETQISDVSGPGSVGRYSTFTVSGDVWPVPPSDARTIVVRCYLGDVLKKTVRAAATPAILEAGQQGLHFATRVSLPTAGEWILRAEVAKTDHSTYNYEEVEVGVNRPTLSMHYSGVRTTFSRSALLSGYLKSRTGHGVSGKTVRFQQYSSGHWKTIKYLRTSSTGRVSSSVKPMGERIYRFYFAGDSNTGKRASSEREVQSCYASRKGYADDPTADYEDSVYLTKGAHRLKVYSKYGVGHATIERRTWSKVINSAHVPASRWRTYYVTVPSTGHYYLGVSGNRHHDNYIKMTIW